MLRKNPQVILKSVAFLLVAVSCSAQDKPASPRDPNQASAGQMAATPRGVISDEDRDSPDIPPFARGRIDEETYLRLRDELIAIKRGLPDLLLDPAARTRAIRQLERQEESLRRLQEELKRLAGKTGAGASIVGSVPTWTPLGPDPIPNGQTDPNLNPVNEVPVSGRVTAIAVDPADANTVYVGAAQGGLYRTQDGGATWTPLMDSAQSLAVGAITIDPLNHDIVFVGTGEGNFSLDSFFGVGLYIIRGATTATPTLAGPFNSNGTNDVFTGRAITQILVNPTNDNDILVSTSRGHSGMSGDSFNILPTQGVYLSTNALSATPTFLRQTIQTAVADRAVTDMAMDPGNANTIIVNVLGTAAAGDGGIWVSTAGDPWAGTATWMQTLTKNAIGKLAVNRSGATPATTFFATFDEVVSCTPSGGTPINAGGTMNRSTNGGVTWVAVPAASGFCGGQCFYDMSTAIDPGNVNNILVAGSAGSGIGACTSGIMGKSTNGGATFNPSQNFLHADSHATVFAPSNHSVVYAGNDGGIFVSKDAGATWQSINTAGFNATQFESLSLHPTDPNFTIGGTQDNGTEFMKPDGTWTRADFGDGGFSGIDQSSIDVTNVAMYHTYFNQTNNLIGFAQVTNPANAREANWNLFGCGSGNPGNNGINCADAVLFYAPLALGPGNPNTVYFGTDHLYRSTDRGVTNVPVSQAPLMGGVPVSAIGISAQDDNFRIVGLTNGHVFTTTTGSNTLTDVTGGWTARYIARAVIDPNKKNTSYVTLDGYGTTSHVWMTSNLSGAPPAWTAISNGLPDVPVNAFVVDPGNSNYLYAGMDIGVFTSTDGGATWNPYGTGLPRVAVFDLNIQPVAHKIRAGTHGRGAWEIAAAQFNDTTALSASNNSPAFGSNVTFTATLNGGAASKIPTGNVTFMEGATNLGSGALDNTGKATSQTSALALGMHNITAVYAGDNYFLSSTSPAAVVNVVRVTTTTVVGSPMFPGTGANVTFTATVDKGTGTVVPTGTVTFADGATMLGTGTLDATGKAAFQTSALTLGLHNITATYGGDTSYATSVSTALAVDVGNDTTTSVMASANSVLPGASVTFTATVNKVAGTLVPTGTVTFLDGTTALGTGPLSSTATATFQTSSLAAGAHTITAVYSGDTSYGTSTSAGIVVNVGDYTLSVASATATVTAGNSATYLFTVTPQGGFANPVGFACIGLPPLASCSFVPPTVTPSGTAVTSTLTITTTAHTSKSAMLPGPSAGAGSVFAALTGLGFLGMVIVGGAACRKRLRRYPLMLLIALGLAATMVGCGGTSGLNTTTGTPAGTTTVTVTATSGTLTHVISVTLVVQ